MNIFVTDRMFWSHFLDVGLHVIISNCARKVKSVIEAGKSYQLQEIRLLCTWLIKENLSVRNQAYL